MEEIGFVDQFVEFDKKIIEHLEVVIEAIANLVDVGIEPEFHDQMVESNMEIAEHLVVVDLVVVDDELYIAKHLIVSHDIGGVVSFSCVDGDLNVDVDVDFLVAGVDSLVVDVKEGF